MNIAIIGAGFSGMAIAWHLLKYDNVNITLFDPAGIGGGASGISAGLLHPYAGLHSKLNWKGREGYTAATALLESSAKVMQQPVYSKTGLIRIAMTEANEKDYALCAHQYSDVDWLDPDAFQMLVPQAVPNPAILIKSALVVDNSIYLEGLWKFCSKKGSKIEQRQIFSLEELKHFDVLVVANGAAACRIKELSNLPITPVKGQILELAWPKHLAPLSIPINSQAYIIMSPDKQTCLVGATYERNFKTAEPDEAYAIHELLPKAIAMIPDLKNAKVLRCRSAFRASTPDHKPYFKQFNSRCWILSGMGSKGLLYHSLFAEQLSREIAIIYSSE